MADELIRMQQTEMEFPLNPSEEAEVPGWAAFVKS